MSKNIFKELEANSTNDEAFSVREGAEFPSQMDVWTRRQNNMEGKNHG